MMLCMGLLNMQSQVPSHKLHCRQANRLISQLFLPLGMATCATGGFPFVNKMTSLPREKSPFPFVPLPLFSYLECGPDVWKGNKEQ